MDCSSAVSSASTSKRSVRVNRRAVPSVARQQSWPPAASR